jgi:hypothetical protein
MSEPRLRDGPRAFLRWPWLVSVVLLGLLLCYCGGASGPPQASLGSRPEPVADVSATPAAGAHETAAARTPALEAVLPGDSARAPAQALEPVGDQIIVQTRYFANLERENSEKRLQAAESEAGSSTIGYLRFLEEKLFWMMRRDAVASLDAGRCYFVPGGHSFLPDLFDGVPYLAYSTGPRRNGQSTSVAVPMIEAEAIKELERTVRETREAILERYVAEHNLKPEAERAHVHERFGAEIVGLPAFVADMVRYRLRWSEDGQHYLRIVP